MKLFAVLLIAAGLSLAFNLDTDHSHANPALEAVESIVVCSDPVAEIAGEAPASYSVQSRRECGGNSILCMCFGNGSNRVCDYQNH